MIARLGVFTVLVGLLAACAEPEPVGGEADGCGAAGLQFLLGQSDKVLETLRFAGPVRIIRPGMGVTMDYSAERLNIEIDAAGKISRLTCG